MAMQHSLGVLSTLPSQARTARTRDPVGPSRLSYVGWSFAGGKIPIESSIPMWHVWLLAHCPTTACLLSPVKESPSHLISYREVHFRRRSVEIFQLLPHSGISLNMHESVLSNQFIQLATSGLLNIRMHWSSASDSAYFFAKSRSVLNFVVWIFF